MNFRKKIRDFKEEIQESEERINEIKRVVDTLSGAEILEAYAKDFDEEAEESGGLLIFSSNRPLKVII